MPSQTNIILIILAIIILGAAGYLLFGKSPTVGLTANVAGPASQAELTFLGLTARIDPVKFNTDIPRDPRFSALVDIRTAIISETAGRIDPFAPLGR